MTPEQFFKSVIGKAWANGGNGPDTYDCWGLVRAYYREVRGTPLPVVDVDAAQTLAVRHAFADHPELSSWQAVDAPHEGDAVLMGKNQRPDHVGLWLGGGVLHSIQGGGVIYTTPLMLRHSGWNILGNYRHT